MLSFNNVRILLTVPPGSFFSSHVQMMTTFHPSDLRSDTFLASLSTFLSSFGHQYSALCFGMGRLHFGHLCQKHPFINTAHFFLGSHMSGFPGAFFQFRRYPGYPASRRALRTISSGEVPLDLLDFMHFLTPSVNGGSNSFDFGILQILLCGV